METDRTVDRTLINKYEAALGMLLVALAYWCRENPILICSQILYLLLLWKISQAYREARRTIQGKREEIKALKENLARQNRAFERSDGLAEVGLMASGVAHDLNNVFSVILGFIQILRAHRDLAPEALQDIVEINSSASLGYRLVANFMRQAETYKRYLSNCDLHSMLQSALVLTADQRRKTGVKLRLNLSPTLPAIAADFAGLQKVLLNLVSNAVRAMPRGGILAITTSVMGAKSKPASVIRVTVEDSGPGLPEDILTRIFKPFSLRWEKQEGAGLGLYLGAAIARQHRGSLCAENRDEGGARFTLTLPGPREKANPLEAPASRPATQPASEPLVGSC